MTGPLIAAVVCLLLLFAIPWCIDVVLLWQARRRARRLYERLERDHEVYVAYMRRLQAIHGRPGRN